MKRTRSGLRRRALRSAAWLPALLALLTAAAFVQAAAPAPTAPVPAEAEAEAETEAEAEAERRRGPVLVTRVDGAINGAVADHTLGAIEEAETTGAALLILELDTPGGRLDFTKDIITGILNARVPVVVYVAPRGAWAGSAGAFITMAAHIAVMAPGSTIGAAHPVFGGPGGAPARDGQGEDKAPDYMMEKAENISAAYIEAIARERDRNVEWAERAVRKSEAVSAKEALELGVIDLLAEDRDDLLEKLQGRRVRLEGRLLELDIEATLLRELEPSLTSRVFQVIGDPNVAVLLLLAGLALLYFEFNQPGLLFPGIIGAALLVLGLLATQMLPFSWTGIVFCMVGLGLIAAELFVASFGVLPAIGLGFLLLGGSMIFDRPDLSDLNVDFFGVLLPAVLGIGLCLVLVVVALSRTMGKKQQSGNSELLGMCGEASTRLAPSGKVFLRGEYWNADADMEIEAGSRIEVVEVRGMRLLVKPATGAGA